MAARRLSRSVRSHRGRANDLEVAERDVAPVRTAFRRNILVANRRIERLVDGDDVPRLAAAGAPDNREALDTF
jgi:hypothetical protein